MKTKQFPVFALCLLLALSDSVSNPMKGCRYLAPRSAAESHYFIPEEVRKMPAWELLEALDLLELRPSEKLQILSEKTDSEGYREVHIEIPKPHTDAPRGLEILHHEIGETTRFVLLYNELGHLVAIFPFAGKLYRSSRRYFDLSPYYFDIPQAGDREARSKWENFNARWEKDQEIMERYSLEYTCFVEKHHKEHPFIYVKLSPGGFERNCFVPVRPNTVENLSQMAKMDPFERHPGIEQFIFPLFPTIYSPMEYQSCDSDYYRVLFRNLKDDAEQDKRPENILIMGPGTGLEAWLASLLLPGSQIYAAGINPLEIANTRATAKLIPGLKIHTKIHDNLLSEAGEAVFGGQFDRIWWNMPALQDIPNVRQGFFSQYWDGKFTLHDLLRCLEGLHRLLDQNGKSLLWNTGRLERVLEHFGEHGLQVREATSSGRSAREYRVYIVSHAVETSI